jgi:hypothetical protein
MTIHILIIFYVSFLAFSLTGPVVQAGASVEVLVDGRMYSSFDAYSRSKTDLNAAAPMVANVLEDLPGRSAEEEERPGGPEVAGIKPSLTQIIREFQGAGLGGRPLCAADGLAQALELSAQGKTGPLLVVADASRVRVMELR